ncbi:MAG: glycosyltransferase, partial [Bacteroidota bacterium]
VMDQEIFQNTPLILAASEYIRSYTIRLGAPPERVKVLHPPLDISNFNTHLQKEREHLRAKMGFTPEDHVSLFVSFSHDRKGLDILLFAFRQMENQRFKLVVVGKPVAGSLPGNIISVGPQQNLPEWYTLADVCVHPARMEPFGQVIAESLACGTPVLISGNVGAKAIVQPQFGEIMDTLNPAIWAKAIKSLPGKNFKIPADFGTQLQLDIETHMQKMLSYWQATKSSK